MKRELRVFPRLSSSLDANALPIWSKLGRAEPYDDDDVLCINSTYPDYCSKTSHCEWRQSPDDDGICYPVNYLIDGSELNSKENRDDYIKSYLKNKNSPIEIQSEHCLHSENNIFLQIGDKISGEGMDEIYDIELFESNGSKIEFPTPICMEITGINEDDIESDIQEFNIDAELAKHNLGPAMYDYIITEDYNIVPRIVSKLSSKNSDILDILIRYKYIRLIFMEKLDGYTESLLKNKNMPIEIQSEYCLKCTNNIFLQIEDKIGAGYNGEIYDIELFESNGSKIELPTPICMKIAGINEDDIESDKQEFTIGEELSKHNIGPVMYDYIITNDSSIVPRIIRKLNTKGSDILEILMKSQYIRLIFMQKLDGYTLSNTHYNNKDKPVLSRENKEILCEKITKMHELGYIHNDLHQDNIFIDKKEPYIIDFGYTQKIIDNDGSKANFMIDKDGAFTKDYGKTLGNYITDGDKQTHTLRKQYCKKADWTCERGYQGELTHRICKNNYTKRGLRGINEEDILKTEQEIKENNESGYLD